MLVHFVFPNILYLSLICNMDRKVRYMRKMENKRSCGDRLVQVLLYLLYYNVMIYQGQKVNITEP